MTKYPMTNASWWTCGAMCVGLALTGCEPPRASVAKPSAPAGAANNAVRVSAGNPVQKTLTLDTFQPGWIEAYEQAPLFAKVAGYVDQLGADIGDRVTKGQTLLKLRVPELADEQKQKEAFVAQAQADLTQADAAIVAAQAAVRTAEAQLAGTQAGILTATGEHDRWRKESDRISSLVATGAMNQKLADETLNQLRAAEGAVAAAKAAVLSADAGVEQARANAQKAEADKVATNARLGVAQADLARATTMLGYTEITAPFNGVVTARNVDIGHFVGGSASGEPLMVVAHSEVVRVFADIPETEAPLVNFGGEQADKATVTVQALDGRSFTGTVTRTSWSLDPANRSLRVEIDIENSDGALRPGMYAAIQVRLAEIPNALTLPVSAILREGRAAFVCVVHDGTAVRKPVELGLRSGDEVEIKSGLTPADVVVLKGSASLKPGQPVELIAAAAK